MYPIAGARAARKGDSNTASKVRGELSYIYGRLRRAGETASTPITPNEGGSTRKRKTRQVTKQVGEKAFDRPHESDAHSSGDRPDSARMGTTAFLAPLLTMTDAAAPI